MNDTAKDSMDKLDALVNKYSPIDLATGKVLDTAMGIDLRNIRHHAFSILCELSNLQKIYEQSERDKNILVSKFIELRKVSEDIIKIYKEVN